MPRPGKIPYFCHFCRERLRATPLEWRDLPMLFLMMRPFQCPHCFQVVLHPFSLIGRLPLIGRLSGNHSLIERAKNPSGVLPPKEGNIHTPVNRGLAHLGRTVTAWERKLWRVVTAPVRLLWAIVTRVTRRRRSRGSSRSAGRFLK